MSRKNELLEAGVEQTLSQFELRSPRCLEQHDVARGFKWQRLAAAAGVLIACGFSLWLVRAKGPTEQKVSANRFAAHRTLRQEQPSILALTHTALQEPKQFDAELSKASRQSLPNFQRDDSALKELARE